MRDATFAELHKAKREHTSHGIGALALAERIDAGGETLTALAAAVKEHAAALARALAGEEPADPLEERRDEVADRRQRHAQEAGG
jgi:hypothetical protein